MGYQEKTSVLPYILILIISFVLFSGVISLIEFTTEFSGTSITSYIVSFIASLILGSMTLFFLKKTTSEDICATTMIIVSYLTAYLAAIFFTWINKLNAQMSSITIGDLGVPSMFGVPPNIIIFTPMIIVGFNIFMFVELFKNYENSKRFLLRYMYSTIIFVIFYTVFAFLI